MTTDSYLQRSSQASLHLSVELAVKNYPLFFPFSASMVFLTISSVNFTTTLFTPEMFLGSMLVVGFELLQIQIAWTLKIENLGRTFTIIRALNFVLAFTPMLIIRTVGDTDFILRILEIYYGVISMALIFVLIPLFLMNHQQ